MDERLQQAISAIKAHDNQTAQQLLAQFLKSNPNHPQGWFLLSQVVADRKQQIAFLNKTLALDPEHRQARQKLTALGEAVPVSETPTLISPSLPVSQDQGDWGTQAEATTIPPWMAEEKTYQAETLDQTSTQSVWADFAEPEDAPAASPAIPNWLKDEPAVEAHEEEESEPVEPVAAASPTPATTPAPTPKPAPTKKPSQEAEPLPFYFWLLVLCAVIVFLAFLVQFVNLFTG